MTVAVKPEISFHYLGEQAVVDYLRLQGFDLVRYAEVVQEKGDYANLPQFHDGFFGRSVGEFFNVLRPLDYPYAGGRGLLKQFPEPKLPHWADVPSNELQERIVQCGKRKNCYMRELAGESAHCRCPERILDREHLTSIVTYLPNFSERPTRGYSTFGNCLNRVARLMLADLSNDLRSAKNIFTANLGITDYLRRKPWFDAARHGSTRRTTLGRFHFLGYRDGIVHAIEYKTSKARENADRTLRLGLLRRLGFSVLVLRISERVDSLHSELPLGHSALGTGIFTLDSDPPEYRTPSLPEWNHIQEVMQFRAPHELKKQESSRTKPESDDMFGDTNPMLDL